MQFIDVILIVYNMIKILALQSGSLLLEDEGRPRKYVYLRGSQDSAEDRGKWKEKGKAFAQQVG